MSEKRPATLRETIGIRLMVGACVIIYPLVFAAEAIGIYLEARWMMLYLGPGLYILSWAIWGIGVLLGGSYAWDYSNQLWKNLKDTLLPKTSRWYAAQDPPERVAPPPRKFFAP